MLIDTHCHLNFKAFEGKVGQIIENAKKAGVEKIIVPGARLDSSEKAIELSQKYKKVYAAVGIHPVHVGKVKSQKSKVKTELKKLAGNKKVVAIGECGLDYFRIENPLQRAGRQKSEIKEKQKQLFKIQIELAQELDLPLIIHNRNASKDILEIIDYVAIRSSNHLKGVFHCFLGNFTLLKWALEHGFYIGVDGNITYSKHVKKVVKRTPLRNLLIETDSPYLMPEPIRRTEKFPNEPKNVKIVAEKIAEIKGDYFLNIAKKTTDNAERLFWKNEITTLRS